MQWLPDWYPGCSAAPVPLPPFATGPPSLKSEALQSGDTIHYAESFYFTVLQNIGLKRENNNYSNVKNLSTNVMLNFGPIILFMHFFYLTWTVRSVRSAAPSDSPVGRSRAEIRTRDGRCRGRKIWPLDHHTSLKGQCDEICDYYFFCFKKSTWAPFEQPTTVSRTFLFLQYLIAKLENRVYA